jgi:Lar family restriction alleviation protein
MSEELKACPFCDGTPFIREGGNPFLSVREDAHWSIMCGRGSCMAEGPRRDTREEAIVAWNHRAGAK